VTSLLSRLPRGGGPDEPGERSPAALAGLAAAVVLAVPVVGLLVLLLAVAVVQTLDPAGGLGVGGSTRLAGQLWLLAHGAELELPGGPLRIAPLLLTGGIGWGLSRAAGGLVHRLHLVRGRDVGVVVAVQAVVHALVTAVLAAAVSTEGARAGLLRPVLGALLLAGVAGGFGALRDSGLLGALAARLPGPVPVLGRAVLAGLLALAGGCTAVLAVALAADVRGAAALTTGLGGAGAGATGLAGLSLLLLPNAGAAVAGLAAGPGFGIGTGTFVSASAVHLGPVPALPLLAALPDTQAVPLLAFLAQVLPVLAGLVTGTVVGRRLRDDDGGTVTAALVGLAAGVGLGAATALWVLLAHGRLGDAALASVGAPAPATGLAVAAQAGIAAAAAGAVARWRARS